MKLETTLPIRVAFLRMKVVPGALFAGMLAAVPCWAQEAAPPSKVPPQTAEATPPEESQATSPHQTTPQNEAPTDSARRGASAKSDAPGEDAPESETERVDLDAQLQELKSSADSAQDLRVRSRTLVGHEKDLLLAQMNEADERYWSQLIELAAVLSKGAAAEEQKAEFDKTKAVVKNRLAEEQARIFSQIAESRRALSSIGNSLEGASSEEASRMLTQQHAYLDRGPKLFATLSDLIGARNSLGAPVRADEKRFEKLLIDTAQILSASLHRLSDDLERIRPGVDGQLDAERHELQASLLERRQLVAELQRQVLALMDDRQLDSAQHRQDLIRYTGEVTEDILNAEVAKGLLAEAKDEALSWISVHALTIVFKVVSFALIVGVFALLARIARWIARRTVNRTRHMSSLAGDFFVNSAGRAVLVTGWIVAAAQVGIEVGPLLAGLGIAGFVLGFALQSTLSNFAAGMMILVYRPFDVDDVVEAGGVMGKVHAMNLVSTAIITFDNQMLVVPNSKIWGDVIRNVTHQTSRRVDLVFGIAYSDDIDHAQRILEDILRKNERVLAEPAPVVRLHELGDSSVNFVVRPWVKTEDYWDAYWEVTREVKRRFDREGVSIPFPQRDLHIYHRSERALAESLVVPASTDADADQKSAE